MQVDQELSLQFYGDDDNKIDESTAKISFEFTEKLSVAAGDSRPDRVEHEEEEEENQSEEDDDEDEDEDEDEEEFSFASISDDLSPIAADKVFLDGQIRPVFPLFNQDLLLGYDSAVGDRLPSRPPVDKVFIESPRTSSIASESEEIGGVAAGPYCSWTKGAAPEFNKKSNSTGFSKLWRFKEKMSRSHSDGRDAFVFLNNSTTPSSSSKSSAGDGSLEKKSTGDMKAIKTGEKEKSKKVGKKKKVASLSPHEAYMRSKLTEDERRKSYLPYRPELMGFFTNVHGGGLTRNVHPF